MHSVTSGAVASALENYVTSSDIANFFKYFRFGRGTTYNFSAGQYTCGVICATTANVGTGVYSFNSSGVLTKLSGGNTITISYSNSVWTVKGYGNNLMRCVIMLTEHP